MKLSAETKHLVQKQLRSALRTADILAGALVATIVFATAYSCSCFGIRYTDKGLSTVGLVVCLVLSVAATAGTAAKIRARQPCRSWIAASVCIWCGFLLGRWLGDRYWWQSMAQYYTWKDMASYVNIDPDLDKGRSYMDAGTVYFKEGSYVLENHTVAFRNGATFCVAPIVRAAEHPVTGAEAPRTVNGFALPRSGTVDFWAVGTDCCGSDGAFFKCGDTRSMIARSGLRVLDETSRAMYQLATQEWSASTGLPVRHPLFFTWVKDPISFAESLQAGSALAFASRVTFCLFGSLGVSVGLHGFLRNMRIV